MIPNLFHTSLYTVLLALSSLAANAQTTVNASVDKTSILIGEPIRLSLQADIPENEPIRFFQPDSIAHFEILRKEKTDTNNTAKGTLLRGAIYITSFDSGRWVIPPILLRDSIFTDSIVIDVGYTPFDVSKPYNDIKEIIEADEEKKNDTFQWWYLAAAVIVLAIIFYIVFRKKKNIQQKPVAKTDPYEEALARLNQLPGLKLEKSMYYSELIQVFRLYVQKRKGIESMQQTTGDLVYQLRQLKLPDTLFQQLSADLSLGDLVKFARYNAPAEDDERVMATIRKTITLIEQESKPAHVV